MTKLLLILALVGALLALNCGGWAMDWGIDQAQAAASISTYNDSAGGVACGQYGCEIWTCGYGNVCGYYWCYLDDANLPDYLWFLRGTCHEL